MYPPTEPYKTGTLKVSNLHTLYYELSGNKNGTPVVFLHGGPGGSAYPLDRSWFSPERYNIVLFHQRGAGKSTPAACIEENTTWDLVEDIEKLRKVLNIDKWHVFGGSWGSTLALAYAQTHSERVKALVLRGIFTGRKSEIDFFYQDGAGHIFPEAWEEFIAPVPENQRGNIVFAYKELLHSPDERISMQAAKAWAKWEMSTAKLLVDPEIVGKADDDNYAKTFAGIENHYFTHGCFLKEGQLLEKEEIDKIRHIPTIIVQGRYDVVCPVTTAYDLKKVWPEIELRIIPDAGHSSREPGTAKTLVEATDKFADL